MSDKLPSQETSGKAKNEKKMKKGKKREREEPEPPKLKLDDIFVINYDNMRDTVNTPYILLRETKCYWILARVKTKQVSSETNGLFAVTTYRKLVLPIEIQGDEIRVNKKTLHLVGDDWRTIDPVPVADLANTLFKSESDSS